MQKDALVNKKPHRVRKYVIIGIIIAVLVVVDLFTLLGGNIRYAGAWIECRGRPYQRHYQYFGETSYYGPSPFFQLTRQRVERYYCTPLEAEMDGISADPDRFSFPHLEEQGLPWPDLDL